MVKKNQVILEIERKIIGQKTLFKGTYMPKSFIIVDNITVEEKDSYADFLVRLDKPNTEVVTVNYGTFDRTASNGADYRYKAVLLVLPQEKLLKLFASLLSTIRQLN
jgi:Calx-beta domain